MSNKKLTKRKVKQPKPYLLPSNRNNELKVTSKFSSGPIPSSEVLAEYEKTLPGAADRIITMAENQAAHRIDIEKIVVKGNIAKEKRGQEFGLMIGLAGIFASAFIVAIGYPKTGLALGTATISGLATVFVVGKKKAKKEIDSKPKPR